jgi:hypothetical protein
MKKVSYSVILVFIISLVVAGCSSGNRIAGGGSSKNCGCGLHKGFVGY